MMIFDSETIVAIAIAVKFIVAFGYLAFICNLFNEQLHYNLQHPETLTKKRTLWQISLAIFHLTVWLWLLQSAASHL
jgi:hypothetical protein